MAFAIASIFGLDIAKVVFAIWPGAIGFLIWRLEDRPVVECLSWSVPLSIWGLAAFFVAPDPAGTVMFLLGIAFLASMIFTRSIPVFWLHRVLRRNL